VTIDVLFLAWNRFAYTRAALEALVENTDWSLVHRLYVYDDVSTDGTYDWLIHRCHELRDAGIPTSLIEVKHGSPVEVMRSYLAGKPADMFAKVDNDVCVPPGWLDAMVGVLEADPSIEILGMEAGMTEVAGRDGKPWDGVYRFQPATNIGGVGVFRGSAFLDRPELRPDGRFGFTEWQVDNDVMRGWITPDLPVVLLDRLPLEPWSELAVLYVEAGWQRPWPCWDRHWMAWAWEWFQRDEVPA
jgi:hypothetical protein